MALGLCHYMAQLPDPHDLGRCHCSTAGCVMCVGAGYSEVAGPGPSQSTLLLGVPAPVPCAITCVSMLVVLWWYLLQGLVFWCRGRSSPARGRFKGALVVGSGSGLLRCACWVYAVQQPGYWFPLGSWLPPVEPPVLFTVPCCPIPSSCSYIAFGFGHCKQCLKEGDVGWAAVHPSHWGSSSRRSGVICPFWGFIWA